LEWLPQLSKRWGFTPIVFPVSLCNPTFAAASHFFGNLLFYLPEAFVYSLTSFHLRGFFPGLRNNHSLHDPLVMLAALEAVGGLIIEASFIATFTQRYFGRWFAVMVSLQ
jgi:hypothetical protein